MDKFLSCDWGTTFFRLRLVNYENLKIIAENKNDQGIANTFAAWNKNGADSQKRQNFYLDVISKSIQLLSNKLNLNLSGVPVIVSGMAASNIGMIELPYKEIPIALDGSNLEIKQFVTDEIKNQVLIISGIKSANDVIRGEETKTLGCSSYFIDRESEALIIFPGTHPKHVTVKSNKVIDFKTYMTGEFFNLLTNHSILASSVKVGENLDETGNQGSFKQGVVDSSNGNILNTAFLVRTNDILGNMPKENNFNYLSGLLIGTELRDILKTNYPIYLCGGSDLIRYYKSALDTLGVNTFAEIDGDAALLTGQKCIYSHYLASTR